MPVAKVCKWTVIGDSAMLYYKLKSSYFILQSWNKLKLSSGSVWMWIKKKYQQQQWIFICFADYLTPYSEWLKIQLFWEHLCLHLPMCWCKNTISLGAYLLYSLFIFIGLASSLLTCEYCKLCISVLLTFVTFRRHHTKWGSTKQ